MSWSNSSISFWLSICPKVVHRKFVPIPSYDPSGHRGEGSNLDQPLRVTLGKPRKLGLQVVLNLAVRSGQS